MDIPTQLRDIAKVMSSINQTLATEHETRKKLIAEHKAEVERLNAEKVEKLKLLDKNIQKLEGDMEDLRQRHGKLSLKQSAKEAGFPIDALFGGGGGGGGASSSAGKRKARNPDRLDPSHRSQRDVDRAKMESLESENARLKAKVAARTGGASSSAPPKSVPLSGGEESEDGHDDDEDYVEGGASKKTRT